VWFAFIVSESRPRWSSRCLHLPNVHQSRTLSRALRCSFATAASTAKPALVNEMRVTMRETSVCVSVCVRVALQRCRSCCSLRPTTCAIRLPFPHIAEYKRDTVNVRDLERCCTCRGRTKNANWSLLLSLPSSSNNTMRDGAAGTSCPTSVCAVSDSLAESPAREFAQYKPTIVKPLSKAKQSKGTKRVRARESLFSLARSQLDAAMLLDVRQCHADIRPRCDV
jgi:hypothetical protein